jgi:hypothetical protein
MAGAVWVTAVWWAAYVLNGFSQAALVLGSGVSVGAADVTCVFDSDV